MGTTIHVGGGDCNGCLGCLGLLGIIFVIGLCSGDLKCNTNAVSPPAAVVSPSEDTGESESSGH